MPHQDERRELDRRLEFGRSARISIQSDYQSLLESRPAARSKCFLIHVAPNQRSFARLGIIVSKRTAARAVRRNRLKRWVREVFRHQQSLLSGLDVLVRVREDVTRKPAATVRDELSKLLSSLSK